MNAINAAVTAIFDVALSAFEWAGVQFTLIAISGIFGILALIAFKHISYQRGIKATKDRIKAHLIEIRIYQDDLGIVARAVGKVLLRNFQYLAYNFGPFVPLAFPFVFVLAQLVVRYAFRPIELTPAAELEERAGPGGRRYTRLLGGAGTLVRVELAEGQFQKAAGLEIELPAGLRAVSPLVRVPSLGLAFQEIVAVEDGLHEIGLVLADGTRATKQLAAGAVDVRWMQPERVASPLVAMLWPVEKTFSRASGIRRVAFEYPENGLGWMPGGVLGVLIVFLVASMAFGFALLKPLGIQI